MDYVLKILSNDEMCIYFYVFELTYCKLFTFIFQGYIGKLFSLFKSAFTFTFR